MTLRTLKTAVGFSTDKVLVGGYGLLVIVLSARSSSISEFGEFSLILTLVQAQVAFANFGLGTLVYGRAIAKPKGSKRLLGSAIFIVTILGSCFYAVTLLALSIFEDPFASTLYAAAGLRLVGAAGLVMPQHAMARLALVDYLPARHLTICMSLIATVYSYLSGWSLLAFALIWGIEGLLFAIICLLSLGRRHAKWSSRNRDGAYLFKAAPLAIQTLFIIFYMRFDLYYVGWRFGVTTLGPYAATARIVDAGNLAFTVLVLLISPSIIYQVLSKGRLKLQTLIALISLAGVTNILSVITFVRGDELLTVIFGPEYSIAHTILAIYLIACMFVAYGSIGSNVLVSLGDSTTIMKSGAVGALSNFALSVIFGEMFGVEGVAMATVVSYAVAAGIIWLAVANIAAKRKTLMSGSHNLGKNN